MGEDTSKAACTRISATGTRALERAHLRRGGPPLSQFSVRSGSARASLLRCETRDYIVSARYNVVALKFIAEFYPFALSKTLSSK